MIYLICFLVVLAMLLYLIGYGRSIGIWTVVLYDLDKSVWEKSDITDSIIIRGQKRGIWGMKLLEGRVEAGLLEETK